MKANEAPEKLYFSATENGTHYYTEGIPFEREYIEYTRTDVFIKESIQWLSDHVNDYIINDKYILPNGELSRDWLKVKADMFDGYKRYMEGKV